MGDGKLHGLATIGLGIALAACDAGGAGAQANPPRAPAATVRAADPVSAMIDFKAMSGRWTVTGVAVGAGPVQAFARNDPAYMGRSLTIAPTALAWEAAPDRGATVGDRCVGPVTERQAGAAAKTYAGRYQAALASLGITAAKSLGAAHAVECNEGGWGPEAAGGSILFPIDADNFAMSWYDNVVLKLTRAR